jgi:hypothetical protein
VADSGVTVLYDASVLPPAGCPVPAVDIPEWWPGPNYIR